MKSLIKQTFSHTHLGKSPIQNPIDITKIISLNMDNSNAIKIQYAEDEKIDLGLISEYTGKTLKIDHTINYDRSDYFEEDSKFLKWKFGIYNNMKELSYAQM